MKKIPVLPRYFQWIGLILLLLMIPYKIYQDSISGIRINTFVVYNDTPLQESGLFEIMEVDIGFTLFLLISLLGLTFIAFAKTKIEDEMIQSIRLYSWSWAILIMIGLGILITLSIYGMTFVSFALLFGHILLILFIIIFRMNYYRLNKGGKQNEE
ncbi:hypothetical protein ACP6L2_17615 [Sphingobacterium lactis]|uniref:hypothetical protein n=1 Tax=Sphingobacterium lactis TaxID=797291 RepID=UPI003F820B01